MLVSQSFWIRPSGKTRKFAANLCWDITTGLTNLVTYVMIGDMKEQHTIHNDSEEITMQCSQCKLPMPESKWVFVGGRFICVDCYMETRYTFTVCPECKKFFLGYNRSHQIYCSRQCYNTTRARKAREKRAAMRCDRWCQMCSVTFTATRSDQRYCSLACKQKAYRSRARCYG